MQRLLPPLVENACDAIALIDDRARFLDANAAACQLLGQSRQALLGHLITDYFDAALEEWLHDAQTDTPRRTKLRLKTTEPRWLDCSVTPNAMPQGHLLVLRDAEAEGSSMLGVDCLAMLSHELRTPLTSLHSALALLETGQFGLLNDEGQELLAIANLCTGRLMRLVNRVLDVKRLESVCETLQRQPCNTSSLIAEAIATLQPLAQHRQVAVIAHPADESWIWADADAIVQILLNLIGNAIKFSSPGNTVEIAVELKSHPNKPHALNADTVIVSVCDRGRGIPAEQLQRIFEPFCQVEAADARQQNGTGLGLAICRQLIARHGGEIWVESVLGEGSTFSFSVPVCSTVQLNREPECCP